MDYYKRKAISGVLLACFMVIMIRFGFFKSDSNQVDFSNRITIETIDYGDGQKAYIQKKGNDLIIQQSYQKVKQLKKVCFMVPLIRMTTKRLIQRMR